MNLGSISHRSAYSYCYPIDENRIRINIRTGKEVNKVTIIHGDPYSNGVSGRRPWYGTRMEMEKRCELAYHMLWSCILSPAYKREQYYFELISQEETIYMLEDGFYKEEGFNFKGKMKQYFKMPWLNGSDVITVPSWVKDTVWYQIMPDRFCKGGSCKKRHKNKPWETEGTMTYEDFYGGDLKGIISKLGYLEELGITGIYLTPLFESESNHKYNTTDYRKIDPDFGTEEEMKELVQKAHDRKIKIMIDAVFNHCGEAFAPWRDVVQNGKNSSYYDWFYIHKFPIDNGDIKTRDGRCYSFAFEANMPKLNTNNKEVMKYFIDLCKYWVTEWHIDGIRFDVGNEISHTFLKRLRLELKAFNKELFLLGEIWHDATQWLQGDEYDSVMNYPFLESIHDFWNDTEAGAKDLMFSLNRIFTMYPEQIGAILFQFLDSHDVMRAYARCNGLDGFLQQLVLLCTMQGSICLYYGTEIGMDGGNNPYNRKCMPWKEIAEGNYLAIYEKVCRLIKIRKTYPQCGSEKIEWMFEKENSRLIHYKKQIEGDKPLEIYINAGRKEFGLPRQAETLFEHNCNDGVLSPGGAVIIR